MLLYSNLVALLAQKQRLTGKDVMFITRKRQYISQGLFGFFYIRQYPNLKYNQISSHVTIKLSKRAVVRHMVKRAIIQSVQENNLVNYTINDAFHKFFIVVSKDRVGEIDKKIANLSKKDTIKYIRQEFEKAWKGFATRLISRP